MEISLLANHPAEAPKIAKWYYVEWAHIDPDMTEQMVLDKVTEKAVNRNAIPMAIVGHIDGELVGVLELKLRENNNYPEYENWIGGVFTNSSNRGQGVASKLLTKAKELALNMEVQTLHLQCESFNIALYVKHGFKTLHKAQHHEIKTTIMAWKAIT